MESIDNIILVWWVLFIVGTLFLAIRIYVLANDKGVLITFLLKIANSLLFGFFALFVLWETNKLTNINFNVTSGIDIYYLIIGIIVCMLGDVIIAIRNFIKKSSCWNQIIFSLGAVLFVVAYLSYLVALWCNNSLLLILILTSAVITIITVWWINKAWDLKAYACVAVFLYLCLAICVALHAFLRFDINNFGTVLLLAGVVLFLISDVIMIVALLLKSDKTIRINKNLESFKINTVFGAFVIPIYFWGQMVVSLSLVWL